jgi:hypothetical protein
MQTPVQAPRLALRVDGLELDAHHVIAALGVTTAGEKRVPGLWEGASENAEVCRALLEDLVRRGLHLGTERSEGGYRNRRSPPRPCGSRRAAPYNR